ncbi:unnamed protein product [Arctogadus glacialis]
MSRADWSFLEHLLEEGQEHSTRVGRVWLTVLLLFRMLVLGVAAESAWDDEQCNFVCNTEQPGCESVCYDRAFPISHFRYFVLQVIFVSTPTIFYFGYLAVRTAEDQSEEEEEEEEADGVAEGERAAQREGRGRSAAVASSGARAARKGKGLEVIQEEGDEEEGLRENAGKAAKEASESPKLKGRLLGVYTVTISVTVLLEAGFIAGLWVLYDGFVMAARYECVGLPCPHTVDCFVSRPTEKTIFTIYTQAIAGLSLLLNLLELLHLLQLAVSQRLEKRYRRGATSLPSPRWRRRQPGGDHTPIPLPAQEAPSYCPAVPGEGYPEPPGSYVVVDTLRAHVKKHVHGNGKHRKDNHKVHAKLKHYV